MSRWLISDQPGPILPAALTESASDPTVTTAQSPPGPPLLQTLWIGFRHILPAGVDHLMFLLSLVLLCQSLRSLVLLVTAFTIGHCLTRHRLALEATGAGRVFAVYWPARFNSALVREP